MIAENDKEIICGCVRVSLGQIKEQINEDAIDVDAIGDNTGAGTFCGTCREKIRDILGLGRWQTVQIKKILPLTPNINAYHIIPALGETLTLSKAGQYVVMQCFINGDWINRSYTLTSAATNNAFYEIAIKHEEEGIFSSWLLKHENETLSIRISTPDGKFTPNFDLSIPIVCLMAGIGITPSVAFARTCVETNSSRPIYIHYSAHLEQDFAYLSELNKLSETYALMKVVTRSTQNEGRLQQSDLAELTQKFPDAEYFICGPADYEKNIKMHLLELGISEHKIIVENFSHFYDPA